MPKYYFHLRAGVNDSSHEGLELCNLAAAREHAVTLARLTNMEKADEQGSIDVRHRIDIKDVHGTICDVVRYSDVGLTLSAQKDNDYADDGSPAVGPGKRAPRSGYWSGTGQDPDDAVWYPEGTIMPKTAAGALWTLVRAAEEKDPAPNLD